MALNQHNSTESVYIAGLIHRHRERLPLSEQEAADLHQWLSSEEHQQLFNNVENRQWLVQQLQLLEAIDTSEQVAAIFNKLSLPLSFAHQAPVKKIMRWRTIAAAAILIVAAGIVLYNLRTNTTTIAKHTNQVMQDVAPGGNKAVLTLSDGRFIVLDSTGNGLLAQQGNVQVNKTGKGELQYTAQAAAAGQDMQYNLLTTPRGGQFKLLLPDGSKVWLNAASSIRYPVAFTGNSRKVEITGEVYFEIAQSHEKPFYVSINNKAEVEVLGTHFNINAYEEEAEIKTTLLQGSIKVKQNNPAGVLLKPGQQAAMPQVAGSNAITIKTVNAQESVAWLNGYFHFDKADLQMVMRQLCRWYDVDVVYTGTPPARKFEGEIQSNLNLSDVLDALSKNHVHFKVEQKKIIVSP